MGEVDGVADVDAGMGVGDGVGAEDGEAGKVLKATEEGVDVERCVAVVVVADCGASAEEGVGLVEEEDGLLGLGGVDEVVEVLLGVADVGGEEAEVEAEEIAVDLVGEGFGGERGGDAVGAEEEGDVRAGDEVAEIGGYGVEVFEGAGLEREAGEGGEGPDSL